MSYGDSPCAATAFVGYEVSVGGASPSLAKLQLQKDAGGWRVANVLPSDQIHDAHPLDTTVEGRPARTAAEAVAGLALESKLQREQLMPGVRGTFVSCIVDKKGGHGTCNAGYALAERLGTSCRKRNFRMAYQGDHWIVTGEIGPDERVDTKTGAVVKQKPSVISLGCQ